MIACIQEKPCPTCPPSRLVCPSPTPTCVPKPSCPPGKACPMYVPAGGWCSPTPTPTTTFKLGDINEDGKIDVSDYQILISCSVYSKDKGALCNTKASYRTNADLNHDGKIDLDDISTFIRLLYQTPK